MQIREASEHSTLSALSRGDIRVIRPWVSEVDRRSFLSCVLYISFGCALYGYTLGFWRSDEMAIYTAIKLPLLIFFTVIANGLINGIFSQLLGVGLGFRQTMHTILISFATFSVIVASLSPVKLFVAWNMPQYGMDGSFQMHGLILSLHFFIIAFAGILANLKMLKLMHSFSGEVGRALKTFFAWTSGNLLVGAQISYIMRPFFGTPGLEVQFLRDDPFERNFFESLHIAFKNALGADAMVVWMFVGVAIFAGIIFLKVSLTHELNKTQNEYEPE